ncbi:hypothetical protein [Roseimicrobium sp. ORNL1]|uniref:hypothetical protein n=1 Tax=Roseimicrobium sp. ORNL1 TaxID=2711231 RepID=UPI0013E1D620|nr:hypothetical protein [Roseimicrobium sp. ORNL1]QIF04646.1 hypothetical protein G5S37_24995 [Roseimicrobium sp. ORNL1]
MNVRTLFVLCGLFSFAAAPSLRAQEKEKEKEAKPATAAPLEAQVEAMATSTGAFAGGTLYSVYLGVVDAEAAHTAGLDAKVIEAQVVRHLAVLHVVNDQVAGLRKTFAADPTVLAFLDQLDKGVALVGTQGAALLNVVNKTSSREDSKYEAKKDASRDFLKKFMSLPENREILP